jgi:dihydrofolate reductase
MARHPELIIIAAIARSNRVIGKHGKLPWHIPEDLEHFRRLTWGHAVIMGRKTWELDLERRPLPHRQNWVVTHDPHREQNACTDLDFSNPPRFVTSIEEAIAHAQDQEQIFIVGGASIYEQTLAIADRWELTLIDGSIEGDVQFPDYQALVGTQFYQKQVEVHRGFQFETYVKLVRDECSPVTPTHK